MPINKFTTLLDLARQAKILTGETATFDGKIQLGIPFSGYPTGVDTGTTVSLGVVGSETAIFSGGTGTTVFDVANSASPNYSPLFNGFSGNVWTNPLFSGNTSGLTLPITPLSAETQIVGPVWVVTQTGMTGDYVIDTQYTGYTITYSFTFGGDVPTTAYTSYSGFTTASQENFSAGTLDYKGPLDYISSVEDATIDGRLTTNKLTVMGGASSATTGYVLTQTGDTGEVGWVFNSSSGTTTYWDEGSGLFDKLGNHTMSSGSNTDFSIIAGGEGNEISAGFPIGKWNAILGGSGNTISASNFAVIRNAIIGGEGNEIGGGGGGNENCVIIGGQNNSFTSVASDSVIIGMSDKTVGSGDNKVYTPSLDITGDFLITNDSPFSTTSKQVYTNFTTSGITQMNISGGSEDLTFLAVNSPNYGGISMGIRGETSIYNAYGAPGDGYIYSSVFNNGLNIISQPTAAPPSTAQTTDDYIRFYAGRDALYTSDIHIQGSGTTRGNIGINNESPTSKLDIIETTGYQQLRLRTSYTPTSTADANGEIGDIAWDDDYIYIKTSIGWRRSTLTSF